MSQLALDLAPAPRATAPAGSPKRAKPDQLFLAWLELNQPVYELVRELALEARRSGVRRLSIAKLVEELRADPAVRTVGSKWKLDNSLRAPMARLLMQEEPELLGAFEVRTRRSR